MNPTFDLIDRLADVPDNGSRMNALFDVRDSAQELIDHLVRSGAAVEQAWADTHGWDDPPQDYFQWHRLLVAALERLSDEEANRLIEGDTDESTG